LDEPRKNAKEKQNTIEILRGYFMKKYILLLLIAFILLLSFSINVQNVVADESDPCTVYGTVKDENGIAIEGAIVTVENLNTKEMNSDGKDTITGSPVPVIIDSDGVYTFELINLKSGYNDGDEIIVTAEKNGIIDNESTIIRAGSWGARVDITLGVEENQEKGLWYASLFNNWILIIPLVVIIAIILTVLLLKRRKGAKPKTEQIKGGMMGGENTKKVAEEEIVEAEEVVVYECPECSEEIEAEDNKCPNCGVEFAEMWNLSTPLPT